MTKTGILISYFTKRDDARESFGKLQRKGYRRVVLVSKGSEGKVRTRCPFRLLLPPCGVIQVEHKMPQILKTMKKMKMKIAKFKF